ncbi:MAG: sugar phosphate isomerase/epimerase [Candidatus Omnitrophota bacterium]|nr:sugar phosphate isomerase/epimerase [Candidatus Omnitrophota bacterium]
MFSLSTSWNASRHSSAAKLIDEIKSAGFDTVELGFTLPLKTVEEILKLKRRGEIKVSSLHNMCPLPVEIAPEKASPDYYSLSSTDDGERAMAVKVAMNTIDYAKMFDARAVVFHIGRVEMQGRTRELASLAGDKEKFESVKKEMVSARDAKKDPHMRQVIKSLEDIVPYAAKKGIAPAVENRYYYREIPLMDEFEEIFRHFKTGELFYWHDVGHAEVFERLGFYGHLQLLSKFSSRLLGMHLHDIIGLIDDHKAPGAGTFDFNVLKPYISKDTIKVIEAHHPASIEDLRRGVEYLTKILGR